MRTIPIIALLSTAAIAETSTDNRNSSTSQSPKENVSVEQAAGAPSQESSLIVTKLTEQGQANNAASSEEEEIPSQRTGVELPDATTKTEDQPSIDKTVAKNEELKETEDASHFTLAQQKELKKIAAEMAKDYIAKNPESLVQSIRAYGEAQQKIALAEEAKKYTQYKDELMDEKNAFVTGNKSGNLKLVAFVEPNCGHCRNFEAHLDEIQTAFGDLKVYIHPLAIFTKEKGEKKDTPSEETVRFLGALKSHAPERYEAIAKQMALSQTQMNRKVFLDIAKKNGVDIKKLEDKKYEKDILNFIAANKALAEKLKLDATPKIVLFDATGARMLESGEKDYIKKVLSEAQQKNVAGNSTNADSAPSEGEPKLGIAAAAVKAS